MIKRPVETNTILSLPCLLLSLKLYGWDTNENPTQKETVKGAHQVNGSMVERRERMNEGKGLYHWPVYSGGIRMKGRKGEKETLGQSYSISRFLPPR